MQVSTQTPSYTAALFQPSAAAGTGGAPLQDQASRYQPGQTLSAPGYAPPMALTLTLPPQTQAALDLIQSIIETEQAALKQNVFDFLVDDLSKGMTAKQRQELEASLETVKLEQLSAHDGPGRQASQETLDASRLLDRLQFLTNRATRGLGTLVKSWTFGTDKVQMTREELVDRVITRGVDRQIDAMKKVSELTNSPEYLELAARDGSVPRSVPPMTEEEEAAARADLLAHRRAQYKRGELNIEITVYASAMAANYDEAYTTINTATGAQVTNEANAVAFRDEWELSPRKQQSFRRMLEGIGFTRPEDFDTPPPEKLKRLAEWSPLLASHPHLPEIVRDIFA